MIRTADDEDDLDGYRKRFVHCELVDDPRLALRAAPVTGYYRKDGPVYNGSVQRK